MSETRSSACFCISGDGHSNGVTKLSDEKLPPWADPNNYPPTPVRRRKPAVKKHPVNAAIDTLLAHFNPPDNASIWICKRNGVVNVVPVVHGSKR